MSRGPFILGGDFNSCRGTAEQTWPGMGHREFFERVEADFGVYNCYWQKHRTEPRTHWPQCQDGGIDYQDDHIFVSADLGDRVGDCKSSIRAVKGRKRPPPIAVDIDLE